MLDGSKYTIKAAIHTVDGYSARADQKNLLQFVKGIRKKPKKIILAHGEEESRKVLRSKLENLFPSIKTSL